MAKQTRKNHGHQCPVCNPPKSKWIERWKTRRVGDAREIPKEDNEPSAQEQNDE